MSNILKIKLQKMLTYYLKQNHFWINNAFYLYTVLIYTAILTMPTMAWGSTYMANLKKIM